MDADDADLVADAVLSASRVLLGIAARSLQASPEDITLQQYRALVVLAIQGPQSLTTLAAELGAAPSSASRLCDRLVAKKLIRREPSPTSRRQVDLQVTEAGRRVFDQVMRARREEITRVVEAIPPGRRQALVAALEEFSSAATTGPREASAAPRMV